MKNKKLKFIFLASIAVVAGFLFWSFLQKYMTGSRAAQSMISPAFSPETGDIFVGRENAIDLILQTDGKTGISGADIEVYSQNMAILSISKPTAVSLDSDIAFTELLSEVSSSAESARNASVLIAADQKLPQLVRIKINVQGKQEGSCSIKINSEKTQIVGNVEGNKYALSNIAVGNYNCRSDITSGLSAETHFEPPSTVGRGAEKFTKTFVMKAQDPGQAISGFDVTIRFNPAYLQALEVSDPFDSRPAVSTPSPVIPDPAEPTIVPPAPPDDRITCTTDEDCPQHCNTRANTCRVNKCINGRCELSSTQVTEIAQGVNVNSFIKMRKDIDQGKGYIYLTYVVLEKDENLPIRPVLNLNFRCKTKGSGTISVSKGQIVGNVKEHAYNVVNNFATYKCDGSGFEPTVSPIISEGQVKVNLKLRFAGIQSKPKDEYNRLNVFCAVGDGNLDKPVGKTSVFTADSNGVWSGSFNFNVPAGSEYKILCKGPKHLQKKVCDSSPTESWPGTYSCDKGKITLKNGENNFDFSKIKMLVGDLPDRAKGGRQDGVINGYDIAFIRNSIGKSDRDSIEIGDLNLDGIINSIDHALIIATLERKADEY